MTLTEYEKSYSEYLEKYHRVLLWDTEEHYTFHISMLTAHLSSNPENPFALNTRGLAYIETGNGNSINDFYSALRISPHPIPYTNLGDLFLNNERLLDAVECYSQAIALAPEEPTTYRLRAKAHIALGRLEAAIGDYSRAIEIQPGNSYDHKHRAELYQKMGSIELAELDLVLQENLETKHGPREQGAEVLHENAETKSSILKDLGRIFGRK